MKTCMDTMAWALLLARYDHHISKANRLNAPGKKHK